MRPHSAGDCKRESSPQAAPQLAKMPSQEGRWRQSRIRPGQVASGMRVRAGVAPRVASGGPAASKGKWAGGASFRKRRVGREERCAAPHARAQHFWRSRNPAPPRGYVVDAMVARAPGHNGKHARRGYGRGKFFLTLTLVRVFAGGLGAGYGLESGVDGG